MEEVGVRLKALEPVARACAMPAVSTETIDLFLAPFGSDDVVTTGGGIAAEGERMTVPLARLAAMADAGKLTDMKTLVLVLTLRYRQPDLFRPHPEDP